MTACELKFEIEGEVVCARLSGDVDMANASGLRAEITGRTPNHALGLVLDLSAVDYLDSAGIHMVHHLREDLRAGGLDLRLVIPDGSPINDTLRLAGLDWGDETVLSVDAACRSLEPGRPAPNDAGG